MSAPRPALLVPDWPAPPGVRAASTMRGGGYSAGAHASFNLGAHCDDDPGAVEANRALLARALGLPAEPCWLEQVHGARVVDAATGAGERADAAVTGRPGVVCAVLTADCLPVLLCDRAGTRVGVAHAGWRGLTAGVLEAAVDALGAPAREVHAWLGPTIGRDVYEVGPEVREALSSGLDQNVEAAFAPSPAGRWLADLTAVARLRLAAAGVRSIHGGGHCTHAERERFFSYRRDGVTGRMATLIWRG